MFLAGKLNQIKSCFFKLRLHKEDPKEIIYDSEYDYWQNPPLAKFRRGSRIPATSKTERFVIIVNGFQLGCCRSPISASEIDWISL